MTKELTMVLDVGALARHLKAVPWTFDEPGFTTTVETAGWTPGRSGGAWRAWTRDGAELIARFHDGRVS